MRCSPTSPRFVTCYGSIALEKIYSGWSSSDYWRVMRMNAIDLLVEQIDRAYDRRSWHGTNLRGSIRGVSPRQAVWRPHPDRHNIEEIVIHAAYWKYAVQRRLTGEKRGSFGLQGSNWFPREDCDPKQWQSDVRQLHDAHSRLKKTVASMTDLDLRRRLSASWTVADLVSGIIA